MLLWFAGLALVLVWQVFRSPALDHRLVVAGALLPLIEGLLGGPRMLHTLLGSVAVLMIVMLATRSRRVVRRRWLGLPIGLLLHLVLDGAWMRTELFWWPFFGLDFAGGGLPELQRGGFGILMELAGAVALWVSWRRFGLGDPVRRSEFLRTGRVDRDLVA